MPQSDAAPASVLAGRTAASKESDKLSPAEAANNWLKTAQSEAGVTPSAFSSLSVSIIWVSTMRSIVVLYIIVNLRICGKMIRFVNSCEI